jgi:hypothetical protein
MKIRPLVSIDTIEMEVQGEDFLLPNASHAQLISKDGEVLTRYQNRQEVKGKEGMHSLHARTKNSGKTLCIEGSPYGHKYGQNVFTSPHILPACIVALKSVCSSCEIKPSPENKAKWMAGEIDLRRVDLAANFKISAALDASDVLHQISLQFLNFGIPMRRVGTSLYWAPRSGKEWTIALYAKGPEMHRKKGLKSHPHRNPLLKECENMIRIEVRLRASELRKRGLAKASAWNENTAYMVFSSYMKKLNFLPSIQHSFDADELEKLPGRLRPPYALHKAGIDLSTVFDPRTLQRHRKDFKSMGIDVCTPNQLGSQTLALRKILGPARAYTAAPEWMVNAGIVPKRTKLER